MKDADRHALGEKSANPVSRYPWKTALTIATFIALLLVPTVAPALKNYKTVDLAKVPALLDFPVPKRPGDSTPSAVNPEDVRMERLQVLAPQNLVDPKHALDHFYAALLKDSSARILHYGDSPTTGDLITADARAMLQSQFGDGGAGFVLIAKPWAWYQHRGIEMEASGWQIDPAGAGALHDGLFGLGGVSFRGSTSATAHWRLNDSHMRNIEVHYLLQPNGGSFTVEGDGQLLGTVDTSADAKSAGYASFKIPPGARQFTLRVTAGEVRLFGADFRKAGPGVVYSALGVNGANVTLLSKAMGERFWTAVLRHYSPDLVIVNYGTNESGYPQFVEKTWGIEMREVVRRLHLALPGVSVLLMSPMDRAERKNGGEIDTIASLPRLVEIEAKVASDTGAAFFNTYSAMGGQGTMARWYTSEPRLVGADFIHPLPAGAKIVGELLYKALRDGYNEYRVRNLKEHMAQDDSAQKANP